MIKQIVKHLLFGAACGCVIFVLSIIWLDLTGTGELQYLAGNFTARALGSMVVGAGFSVSTVAYKIDRLAWWLQIAINVLVGFGIYFVVAISQGWISLASPINVLLAIAVNVLIFLAIGLGYYLINDREAKIINAKLKERERRSS